MADANNPEPVTYGQYALLAVQNGRFDLYELVSSFSVKNGERSELMFNAFCVHDPSPVTLHSREITSRYDERDEAAFVAAAAAGTWDLAQKEIDGLERQLVEARQRQRRDTFKDAVRSKKDLLENG